MNLRFRTQHQGRADASKIQESFSGPDADIRKVLCYRLLIPFADIDRRFSPEPRSAVHGMWCLQCQQDVPAFANAENSAEKCCARCRRPFTRKNAQRIEERRSATESTSAAVTPSTAPNLKDWRIDADLRTADELARRSGISHMLPTEQPRNRSTDNGARFRIDQAHFGEQSTVGKPVERRVELAPVRSPWFSWLALGSGITTVVCGAILVAWSLLRARPELWNIGLPLVLAGQGALVLGLILQLDGMWQTQKVTRHVLNDLDQQIEGLRQSANLLHASQPVSSSKFYSHLSDGAGPQILLADLKGQLDLLALRLSEQRTREGRRLDSE